MSGSKPAAYLAFLAFCVLIAGRDVFADKFLVDGIHPSILLLFFTAGVIACAAVVRFFRKRDKSIDASLWTRCRINASDILLLNAATAGVYAVTILGIQHLSAGVFMQSTTAQCP